MKSNLPLPEMTIERRDSDRAHGVPAPNLDLDHLGHQLDMAIVMNQDALRGGWPDATVGILEDQGLGHTGEQMIAAVEAVTPFRSWAEASKFVVDDLCLEFFNMALRYCLKEGQKHQKEKDFIDGTGIGYVNAYTKRLKVTLEQIFDAKYFYKVPRPLEWALAEHNQDLTLVANAIHPGHWAYGAGHGTKFLTAVEVLRDIFHLDKNCYQNLLAAAVVLSHGRSGNLIHWPQDNLAGGYLTTLAEFQMPAAV